MLQYINNVPYNYYKGRDQKCTYCNYNYKYSVCIHTQYLGSNSWCVLWLKLILKFLYIWASHYNYNIIVPFNASLVALIVNLDTSGILFAAERLEKVNMVELICKCDISLIGFKLVTAYCIWVSDCCYFILWYKKETPFQIWSSYTTCQTQLISSAHPGYFWRRYSY